MFPASKYMRQYHLRDDATAATYGKSYVSADPLQRAARAKDGVFGRGAYSVGKNWRKFSQSVGLAGVGRRIVGAAGNAALGLMGAGEYTTNSLINSSSADVPMVHSEADETGAVTVSRREYIKDVFASGQSFSVESFPINPGLEDCFPWLSQVAANYEEYDLEQCVFTYRSTVTDIGSSTNGQCGTIMMATNYNAGAAPFDDKISMQAYDGSMSTKTTSDMLHGVECDDSKRSGADAHYVRSGPVPVGQDVKSYDHALFQIAQANVPYAAGTALGELWVCYTVVLRKPKFAVARGDLIETDVFVSGAGSETASLPFGTQAALLRGAANSIGCELTLAANSTTITFPNSYSGAVEICVMMEGLVTTGNTFNTASTTGNVLPRKDMFASSFTSGAGADAPYHQTIVSATTNGGIIIYKFHFNVRPATGAVANTFTVLTQNITTAPTQSTITIQEITQSMSYKALAVGPLGLRTDAPVLIDPSGVIVAPV